MTTYYLEFRIEPRTEDSGVESGHACLAQFWVADNNFDHALMKAEHYLDASSWDILERTQARPVTELDSSDIPTFEDSAPNLHREAQRSGFAVLMTCDGVPFP